MNAFAPRPTGSISSQRLSMKWATFEKYGDERAIARRRWRRGDTALVGALAHPTATLELGAAREVAKGGEDLRRAC
jgi:hypothetical protein